ncbi:hypothetical protein MTO96_044774 [Rhipicephalus appendiculatus]
MEERLDLQQLHINRYSSSDCYEAARRREAKAENKLHGLTTEDEGRPKKRVRRPPRPLDGYSSASETPEESEQETLQDSSLNEFMSGTPTSGRREDSFVLNATNFSS